MAPKKLPKNKVKKAKETIGTAKTISDAITPTYVPSEELIFQRTKNRQPVAHPDAHGGMLGNPDLHHKIGKKLRLSFLEKAFQLDPVGGIAGLEQIDIAWGLQAGSGSKAILPMDLHAHRPHHALARAGMLEPWGKDLEGLNSEIASAKSIEELNGIYSEYIESNVIPELDHAEAMQGGYEKSGARGTKVPRNELTDLRDLSINQKRRLEENRIEGLHDLAGNLTLPIMSRHDLTMRNTPPMSSVKQLPQTTAGRRETIAKLKPQENITLPETPTQRKEDLTKLVMSHRENSIVPTAIKAGIITAEVLSMALSGLNSVNIQY